MLLNSGRSSESFFRFAIYISVFFTLGRVFERAQTEQLYIDRYIDRADCVRQLYHHANHSILIRDMMDNDGLFLERNADGPNPPISLKYSTHA